MSPLPGCSSLCPSASPCGADNAAGVVQWVLRWQSLPLSPGHALHQAKAVGYLWWLRLSSVPSKATGVFFRKVFPSIIVFSQCHFRSFSVPEAADDICPCSVSWSPCWPIFLAYPGPSGWYLVMELSPPFSVSCTNDECALHYPSRSHVKG